MQDSAIVCKGCVNAIYVLPFKAVLLAEELMRNGTELAARSVTARGSLNAGEGGARCLPTLPLLMGWHRLKLLGITSNFSAHVMGRYKAKGSRT